MLLSENVIFIVAIATVVGVSSSEGTVGISFEAPGKERRFLFSSVSPADFCGGTGCVTTCLLGYTQSSTGCYLCQCRSLVGSNTNQVASTYIQAYTSSPVGGVFFDKPCNPAVRHCVLQCTLGYQIGTNGCQMCFCRSSISDHNITAFTFPTSRTATRLPTTLFSIFTTPNSPTTTGQRVPHQLTTSDNSKVNPNFNDPCIPSQKSCDKSCGGEFVKGPGGCQYCLCAASIPTQLQATTTTTEDPVSTTLGHYLDMSPTSEACIMAKVICNQKCKNGFISHPDDCLYCSCRNDVADMSDDDPAAFYVTLPNPCVQDTALCGIMCVDGYLLGPRDCQFCTCR